MGYRNYRSLAYKRWRKKVHKRDNYQCQWPGCSRKKGLNVHHILKWANYPSLRFVVSNGITLCKKHHNMIYGQEDKFAKFLQTILINKGKHV